MAVRKVQLYAHSVATLGTLWTTIGGLSQAESWREVSEGKENRFQGNTNGEGGTELLPGTTTGIESTTIGIKAAETMGVQSYVLAGGETILSARVVTRVNEAVTLAGEFGYNGGSGEATSFPENKALITGSGIEWFAVALSAEAVTKLNAHPALMSSWLSNAISINMAKAKNVKHHLFYVELEIETTAEHAARTCGDTITVSDSAAQNVALARTCGDTIALSDESSGLASKARSCGDTITVSDAAVRSSQALARSAGDTIALSDAAARGVAQARTAGDTVSVTDSATRSVSAPRTVGVTVVLADSATRAALSQARTAQDAVSITDSASRALTGARTAGDVIVLSSEARAEGFVPPPSILTFGYVGTRAKTPAYATTTLKTFAYAGTRLATDAEVKTP